MLRVLVLSVIAFLAGPVLAADELLPIKKWLWPHWYAPQVPAQIPASDAPSPTVLLEPASPQADPVPAAKAEPMPIPLPKSRPKKKRE